MDPVEYEIVGYKIHNKKFGVETFKEKAKATLKGKKGAETEEIKEEEVGKQLL